MVRMAEDGRGRLARVRHGLGVAGFGMAVLCVLANGPAAAQFRFFGSGEASTQDIYDTIQTSGFRLVGPLMRNGRVYVADVVDRRRRRERLIISSESGQIMQRFFVDVGDRSPAYAPPPPRTPVARADEPDFFSRLTRGWNDETPPRPPAEVDTDGAVAPNVLPRSQRLSRPRGNDIEPRVATRRDDAPITAKPLPAPAPIANAPTPASPPPATASLSKPPVSADPTAGSAPSTQPPAPAASSGPSRATVVRSDPLSIPGQREPETTAAAKPNAIKPATPTKAAPKADVPVVPLD